MKMHPRYHLVKEAECKFNAFMMDELRDLTLVERMQVINRYMATELKYALRYERHGECETRGDEVKE